MPNNNDYLSPLAQSLTPYVPGEQPKLANLVKLNTNEHPFAPSPKVAEAIAAEIAEQGANLRLYPDPESLQLRTAMAGFYQLSADQVFVGNGSDEVLAHIFAAFFKKPAPLLFPDIGYSFYPVYARLYEVATQQIPLTAAFTVDVNAYDVPSGGVIVANPNAPTGVLLDLPAIKQLLRQQPQRVVVIDEAYIDFGGASAVQLIADFANLVVVHTTSKSRSMAGMRVGCALAQPHLIEALARVKNSFNSYPIDRLAGVAGVASYNDQAYFTQQCNAVMALRADLVAGLTKLGFSTLPSAANFVFTTHPRYPAAVINQYLRERGILVRHFNVARIDGYLRITVGRADQHAALLQALAQLCV